MFNTLTRPHSYWWIIRIEGWEDYEQLIALMKILLWQLLDTKSNDNTSGKALR